MNLDAVAVLDLVGGGLLAAAGAVVLVHASQRRLSALFFAFAGADAASTVLFRLSLMELPDEVRLAARGAYWWFLIVALGTLAAFGVLFPRPLRSRRFALAAASIALALTAATLAVYAIDRTLFWTTTGAGADLAYPTGKGGYLIQVALAAVVAGLLLRAASIVRRAPSASHADQAAFVFGGVVLSYGTIPASLIVLRAQSGVLWTPLPRALSSASFLVALTLAIGALALAGRARGRARNVLFVSVAFLALLMIGGAFGLAASDEIQTIGIFVGPILLAYAILRYAVFDVDARVRRAVTLGLGGAGVAAVFVAAEGLVQAWLQERFLGGIASGVVATVLAGLLAALLMVPIARLAGHVGKRIVPVRSPDGQHLRKLEIYRHALEGARISGGGIDENESRVLTRLRESLGISESEHKAMLAGA